MIEQSIKRGAWLLRTAKHINCFRRSLACVIWEIKCLRFGSQYQKTEAKALTHVIILVQTPSSEMNYKKTIPRVLSCTTFATSKNGVLLALCLWYSCQIHIMYCYVLSSYFKANIGPFQLYNNPHFTEAWWGLMRLTELSFT